MYKGLLVFWTKLPKCAIMELSQIKALIKLIITLKR